MKKIICDGNEACARTSYIFTEIAGIYPITPSSPMPELVDELSVKDEKNIFDDTVQVVEMQSEAGAAGMIHGSLQAGALSTTYTASQGLLLMVPNIYKMVGEMLPGVLHVAARSLSTHALSIFGDHQDVYATRMTGITMIASSSVEEAGELSAVAHLVAIKSSLPVLHFFDGFRTSHELSKINLLEKKDLKSLVDKKKIKEFRNKALNPNKPVTRGTAQNDDIYFQGTESRNKYHDMVPDIVNEYMKEINKLTGKKYKPFEYIGHPKAKKLIIAMGSVTNTIEEVVADLNKKGEKVGLIKVHLYRPFSSKYLTNVIPSTVRKIAVLDRTKEPGSNGEPLYLDVVSVLKKMDIIGGRYGLSSKDTQPKDIKSVYDFLDKKDKFNGFTVGINDDVTSLSIEIDNDYKIKNSNTSYLIYGYGSDGMTSCSKAIIKIIGSKTNKYVQGYSQYDSKKSGGVTLSHLRFSDKKIKSEYYVSDPDVVVCTKENYLDKYDILKGIKYKGTFILVGNSADINNKVKKIIKDKKLNFYLIDAYALAKQVGLGNKISMIMEMAIFIAMEHDYKKEIVNFIEHKFAKKGKSVIAKNIKALDLVENYLEKVKIKDLIVEEEIIKEENLSFVEAINKRKGYDLPVSAFSPDGTFDPETTKKEKREVSAMAPKWIPEKCIQCNQCSMVCPHAVIRPALLNKEEMKKMPQTKVLKAMGKGADGLEYVLAVSPADCTGCTLCVNACPSKALVMAPVEELKEEQKVFDYVVDNVSEKNIFSEYTVKGSQFKKPKFEFSGACAGCGETPYIKLITQLYGNRMVIANATGCSSIYGGSAPSSPYSVPWASSLFEDNAEYGYGMLIANNKIRNRIKNLMLTKEANKKNKSLINKWLKNMNNYDITKEVYDKLDYKDAKFLKDLKEYIPTKSVWTIGGDGWAYDIGYGGLDHVLSTNDNVNVLVLNSEVYSNTGGQSSKASTSGSLAKFTSDGKKNNKKNLAKMLLNYPNCYVATCSIGYNKQQYIKAVKEAEEYQGPSIIICYSPCIAHGIKGGMGNSIDEEKMATKCGYFPLFRYNPTTKEFNLDSKDVDFELYNKFLMNENRFKMLSVVNKNKAKELLEQNKKHSQETYEYYKKLAE